MFRISSVPTFLDVNTIEFRITTVKKFKFCEWLFLVA